MMIGDIQMINEEHRQKIVDFLAFNLEETTIESIAKKHGVSTEEIQRRIDFGAEMEKKLNPIFATPEDIAKFNIFENVNYYNSFTAK